MLALLALFISLYAVAYFLLKYTVFNYWDKKDVPFAKPNIIFGNIWEVITLRRTWSSFIQHMHESYKEHRYLGIYIMFQPALVIHDLEMVKNILIKDFDHFHNNWFEADPEIDPCLGRNPFVLKGKEWKDTRTMITSQFTVTKLKYMFPKVQKVSLALVNHIRNSLGDKKLLCLEVADLCARYTGDAVMSCAYNLEANSFVKKIPESVIIAGASGSTPGTIVTFKRASGLLFKFCSRMFKVTFYGDPIPKLFHEIITDAVNYRKENKVVHNDFLNFLMEQKDKQVIADDTELVGHAFSFFLDGFQTTYSVLSYALLELCLNPKIQNAAKNEVDTVFEKYNGEITYDVYNELQYLNNVALETLRKNPAVKSMGKVCTKAYTLKDPATGKSFTIEKGVPVFWSVRGIHHDPKYYPEPQKFDPDRFGDEAKQQRPKCSFLGFGDGPRICFGRRIGLIQLVLALASILAEFDLKLNDKTTFPIVHDSFHVSDVPVSGLYVDFIRRSAKTNVAVDS